MGSSFMARAIAEARRGILLGHGGPFGSCVVRRGRIIASAHNTVLKDADPTAHAEINAIRAACRKLKSHSLAGCIIYSTCEPCPMCMGAILWARISSLRYGADRAWAAKFGFDDEAFYAELATPRGPHGVRTQAGVMAVTCRDLFLAWRESGGKLY